MLITFEVTPAGSVIAHAYTIPFRDKSRSLLNAPHEYVLTVVLYLFVLYYLLVEADEITNSCREKEESLVRSVPSVAQM